MKNDKKLGFFWLMQLGFTNVPSHIWVDNPLLALSTKMILGLFLHGFSAKCLQLWVASSSPFILHPSKPFFFASFFIHLAMFLASFGPFSTSLGYGAKHPPILTLSLLGQRFLAFSMFRARAPFIWFLVRRWSFTLSALGSNYGHGVCFLLLLIFLQDVEYFL